MGAINQTVTDAYAIYNGDANKVMPTFPDGSVHLSVYSPPFGGMLYQYSSDPADLSNSKDYDEFFEHYAFVVKELHRLTMPGRMTVVHCTDIFKSTSGRHSIIDFPGHIIRCHEENGWEYRPTHYSQPFIFKKTREGENMELGKTKQVWEDINALFLLTQNQVITKEDCFTRLNQFCDELEVPKMKMEDFLVKFTKNTSTAPVVNNTTKTPENKTPVAAQ